MSQAGSSQFQEVIRQELEYSMKVELDKILATAPSNELEVRSMMWMQLKAQEIRCRQLRPVLYRETNHTIPQSLFLGRALILWKSSLDTMLVGDFQFHVNWVTELLSV